ncbi:MAG: YfhO family protein, partial [Bacteroidota bacterium]|nr:YfhO family protein [Bacteroidota bacterium]
KNKQQKSIDDVRKLSSSSKGSMIPEKARGPLSILAIFIALLVFFNGVLGTNKAFNAGDNIASESIVPYINAAQAAGQSVPQWIPNIFCGMPSFAALMSTGARTYDLAHEAFDFICNIPVAIFGGNEAMIHIWRYFIFGLGIYLLLRMCRKTSHLVALFGAFSGMFSTWIVTYVMIGHNTKIFAVMCFPYILLCIEKMREEKMNWKQLLLWISVLAVAIHFLLDSTHPQMVFYQFLAILIYFLTWLISDIIKKRNIIPVARTGIITLLMVGAAFAMSADRYMATLGYDEYSIRGASPLVDQATVSGEKPKANASTGATKSGGLDWNYATQYSFSPAEMITFLVPGWYGFGKLPYDGPEVQPGQRVPGYWGQATTTDAANYTGIVVFFLALIAIFALWKRDPLVPPLAIISLFALLLSFGDNWSIIYKPMFEYFPVFNKFRAPMMSLVLMQMCFPILAALGLDRILKIVRSDDKQLKTRLLNITTYAMYAAAAVFVISLVGGGAIESSLRSGIATSGKPASQYPFLADLVTKTAVTDARLCSFFALASLVVLWLFQKGKGGMTAIIAVSVVFIASAADLWRVSSRPMEIVTKTEYDQNLSTHDYVDFIKQDKSLFRILDLNESTSNTPVAWGLQTIAGYSAAKMREYQDVVDVTGNEQGQVIFNPFMWTLLNTKYIIANGAVDTVPGRLTPAYISKEKVQGRDGKPSQTVVWQNTQVLPRAFFVNRFEVKPPLEILQAMRDGKFNPRDEVFFEKQPEGLGALASGPVNDSLEKVTVAKYENELIEIKTTTSGDRLLFISDTWYPDWKASIDDKSETPIYKANYAFRAIMIPSGTHTLTLRYKDTRYATGKLISLSTNILALLGLAIGLVFEWNRRKKQTEKIE